MQVYLIRHTRVGVEPGLCYGATDVALAESAAQDIERVAAKLCKRELLERSVFSSPLRRCRQLGERLSTDVQFDDRLVEMNFGRWEGHLWSEVPKAEIDAWATDLENFVPPEGESLGDVYRRTASFLDELRQRQDIESALVVSHGGAVRCMLAYALGLQTKHCNRLEIDYGGLCRLHLTPTTSKVEIMNV